MKERSLISLRECPTQYLHYQGCAHKYNAFNVKLVPIHVVETCGMSGVISNLGSR